MRVALLLQLVFAVVEARSPLKILFVGNSFTYGPPPYDRPDQLQLNNLPRMFKLVAESMGERVLQAEDTIGGCTLLEHRPAINAEGRAFDPPSNNTDWQLVNTSRMPSSEACTIPAGIHPQDTYSPCPQLLTRQPYGPWDVVVLQDFSALPSVQRARENMLLPVVKQYADILKKRQGAFVNHRPKPVIASYMTWAYYNGSMTQCPGGNTPGCFPLGTLDDLSNCSSDDAWYRTSHNVPCQGYALARGYEATLAHGADVLVPAGLAQQAARGSPDIPAVCKAAVDAEHPAGMPLSRLTLPLQLRNKTDAKWADMQAALGLFRDKGPDYVSKYCDNGCHVDHHASATAMYLNSLVFFATLFKKSPIGAQWPNGQTVDGMVMPTVDPDDAKTMQRIAHDIVMPHLDVWWNKAHAEAIVV